MNKGIFIGNLTRDPELRTLQSGEVVCSFTVAVNRRANGQETADFIDCSVWGAQADNCAKYLSKGRKVAVEGRVSARAYTDRNGSARAALNCNVISVEFLSSRGDVAPAPAAPADAAPGEFTEVDDDDNPF